MKTVLTVSSLAIVGAYAAAELALASGLALPGFLNAGNALIAFTLISFALVMVADYGRKPRLLPVRVPVEAAWPEPMAAAAMPARRGYTIRRGTEAARLAPAPARVVVFRRNSPAVRDRAA